MCECIKVGLPVDVERLGLTPRVTDLVVQAIRAPPVNSDISRLTPIKERLPDYVEFNHIKLVIAILSRQFGISGDHVASLDPGVAQATHAVQAAPMATTSGGASHVLQKSQSVPAGQPQSVLRTMLQRSPSAAPSVAKQPPPSASREAASKRKLPQWMSANKAGATKKVKKNSLFAL